MTARTASWKAGSGLGAQGLACLVGQRGIMAEREAAWCNARLIGIVCTEAGQRLLGRICNVPHEGTASTGSNFVIVLWVVLGIGPLQTL